MREGRGLGGGGIEFGSGARQSLGLTLKNHFYNNLVVVCAVSFGWFRGGGGQTKK